MTRPTAVHSARALVPDTNYRHLLATSDARGWWQLGLHLAVLGLTGVVVLAATGPWVVAAVLGHGLVLVHLFAPLHEASHRTAFRTPWLNVATAWGCGLVLLMPPTQFRLEHLAHHAHTQDPARDPQFIAASARLPDYVLFATGLPFWRYLAGNLVRHAAGRFEPQERAYLPGGTAVVVTREARWFLAVYAGIAAFAIATGAAWLFWLWLLPRVAGEPWMRLVRMAEHGACPRVADMLRNTRTVTTLAPLRWLAWNMPFHAEHHALPSVPFHALPGLHAHLRDHLGELEDGYARTHRRLLRTARRT